MSSDYIQLRYLTFYNFSEKIELLDFNYFILKEYEKSKNIKVSSILYYFLYFSMKVTSTLHFYFLNNDISLIVNVIYVNKDWI